MDSGALYRRTRSISVTRRIVSALRFTSCVRGSVCPSASSLLLSARPSFAQSRVTRRDREIRNENRNLSVEGSDNFRIALEVDLEIVEIRLLESRDDETGFCAGVRANYRCMGQTQRARQTAREKMENFVCGEISHDFMKDVHQMPPGFALIAHALKFGFRITERRSQGLKLVEDFFFQAG